VSDDVSNPAEGFRGSRAGRYGMGAAPAPRATGDSDMRRMALFAGGVAAVLAVLIGASALTGRHGSEVPVVQADTKPVRVKPENPGGMKVEAAENDVFSGGADNKNAKLAPAAEAPDTKALREVAPPPPAAKPAVVAVAPPAPAPAAKPVAAPAPVVARTPPPAAAPAAAAKPAGKAVVQLAALGTEDAARNEWAAMTKKMPELLGGHQPSYSKIERDGKTYWRVRTAGFADTAQARSFCEHVRAKGGGCSVAEF